MVHSVCEEMSISRLQILQPDVRVRTCMRKSALPSSPQMLGVRESTFTTRTHACAECEVDTGRAYVL